jgi:tetratricopeptide (TPR) repeat protein
MLGQIAMARHYRTDAGWLDRAEEHYRAVVDEYAAGNTGLGRLAAVAYAALADVAAVRGDSDAAVALYLRATDEAEPSPTLKARFYLMAGDLRAAEDQIDAARELYERALAVGREASDQAIVDESQAAVESLAAP